MSANRTIIALERIISNKTKRIKELETLLQQLIWVAEKADTDANEDTTIELARQALEG